MSRRIEPHDILKYRFLSSPRFSPDGSKIAFAVHQAALEENRYISNIWIYDLADEAGMPMQLTSSGLEKTFCWSVDGTKIFFVSERPPLAKEKAKERDEDKKKKATLYSIGIKGGEAAAWAVVPEPVTAIWALSDDRLLLKTVSEPEEPRFEDADYMIFTQVPFCSNGKGFTGRKRTTLSSYTVSTATLSRLSPDDMNVGQVRLSPDRKRALAVGTVYTDVMPETSGVWEFDVTNGAAATLLPQKTFAWSCADAFGDGILTTGTEMKRYGINENARFYLSRDGKTLCLTPELDRGLRNSVICDCRYGLSDMNLAFWVDSRSPDSPKAWFVSTDDYQSHLHTLDVRGKIEQVTTELRSIDDYDVSHGRAAVIGLEGFFPQELYLVEEGPAGAPRERRLTDFNRSALAECDLSVPEYVHLENGTSWGLDCWYMRPIGFEIGRKYPTLLHVHGGPKMTFGDVFVHEMQCWASAGFAVLFCNPRGSDGKGNEFDDIRGKYGTIDYDDLMLFVDWAIETLPFIDKDRMGVTGGSYGGFMTNWIIGHTDRFRAAAAQRGICNWVSMAGISDIGYFFVPDQQGADIWSDVDKLWRHSPLKYADQIRTPTLIIHSDEDHRCEVSQGLQMFTALKRNGVESRICVFKGENHELSRGGRPKPRLARIQEIVKWFKERL
ncbi:MAG: S9 family peptidase [Synergistaceae bacterium]|jgi:dipeptidyl aminopeptidase/acylaminoacyl peptidase|nr:S9 family peptidase [Synergistaceae bacterium]